MQDEHGQATHRVDPQELVVPHGEHRRWWEDLAIEIRPQAEREEWAVVEDPRGGQLDERRRAGMAIGPQRILEVARIQEAVRGEKTGRLRGDLVERRAIAARRRARDVGEDLRAAREDRFLLLARLALEPLVEIAVMADLVAAPVDLRHHV